MTTPDRNVPHNQRHEIKFVASPLELPVIERWIANSDADFLSAYLPRRINNIYFDTIDLLAFQENLSGTSSRTKVRLRWYGEETNPIDPVLEIKQRQNELGFKTLISLKGQIDLGNRMWGEVMAEIKSKMSRHERVWLDEFSCPSVINLYDRKYYESADRALRLTLDTELSAYDQTRYATPNLTRKANLPESIVVELKFSPRNRYLVSEIVKNIPLRRSRNSKYVIGVNSTLYQY